MNNKKHINKYKTEKHQDHVKLRLHERYNLNLSDSQLTDIVSMIQLQEAVFLERRTNLTSVWLVTYNGRKLKAVYSNRLKQLLTVLPLKPK